MAEQLVGVTMQERGVSGRGRREAPSRRVELVEAVCTCCSTA